MSVAAAAGPVIAAASIVVGGVQRHYLLASPSSPTGERIPLVIVLHGHAGRAARELGLWPRIAEREKVLVAAPDGLKGPDHQRGWNDCRADAVYNPKVDDVRFLDELAERLIKEENVDPSRVYVAGMSNGGMMALRAALEMKHKPAAIAAIGASMAANSSCAGGRPVSVMFVNGTEDPVVPFRGGSVGKGFWPQDRGTVVSVSDSAEFWRRADSLPKEPQVEKLTHLAADDPTTATRSVWGSTDSAKVQVEVVRVDGGGHVEPSREIRAGLLYLAYAGRQNRDLETAEEAWAFFKDKRAR